MSTDSDAVPSASSREAFFLGCWHLAGTTLLYWDHLLTLDREIALLWKRTRSMRSYWFFINRYFAFATGFAIAPLPFLTRLSTKTCENYSLFRELALVCSQTITCLVMLIRVYALFGRDNRILCCMIAIAACGTGLTIWSLTGQHGARSSVGGCHFGLISSTAHHLAAPWEALFAFDTFLFCLLIYNAYTGRRWMDSGAKLHIVIIRDGAVYFGVMALTNLANILTYYATSGGWVSPGSLTTLANFLSVTMTSRLILNLHKEAEVGIMTAPTGAQQSTVRWARQESDQE
ncbi:hypothetical protein FB45DRAFT_1061034 [Roridomyces roridus]|uniref:DUF6533 domain-containing protein n=1 Tax=Roridomyces roridus TaxID=1738132 RepID=A0AAD7BM94_9AGAR|nr:hypothetical protein FB45DRAFT_1061034 [Roridomyces roridus]